MLAEGRGDAEGAAKMLDKALADDEPIPTIQRVKALTLRAMLALTMEDKALANKILNDMRQIALSDDECAELVEELERVADLEKRQLS